MQPDKCLSSFLDIHGNEKETYTYSSFHERSRHLAEYLSRQVGLKGGDRALLVYPPGLEIIVAFIACARIGAIPVPIYPPTPANFKRGLSQLTFVARDCDARVALATRELFRSYPKLSEEHRDSTLLQSIPALPNLDWFTTDDVRGQASDGFYNDPGSILFLQYTSGSTGDPKGVIVSHENVVHNCRATIDHIPTGVSWLPQYHDMGLIGYYLYPIITGGTTYGFSPMDFLKRPVLWLQILSRVHATYTSSPNFGFEYCLQEDKIASNELNDLDFSSVRVMMNASEPVRAETYRRFLERFGPYGLRPEAHVVAYGLAENTLAVSSYGRRMVTVNERSLQKGTLHIENAELLNNNQLTLVSCGRPLDGIQVRIVDPKSCAVLGSRKIGEIWLAGKSTCQGYWNRPQLTQEVFCNAVANDPEDENAYLRTGDLGFLEDGELYVCGRIKDLIIIRGVNYYPQDIESIVESTSQKIRTGCVAAFSGNEEEESVVIVAGVRTAKDLPDPAKISQALRTHYYTGPHTIVFAPPRTLVKTTSGKIARSLIRQRWLNGELPAIATYVNDHDKEFTRTLPSGLRERFQYILKSYNLSGNETCTLAEAGIDSLAMAMLLLEIEQMLEEHGITDLVNVIDGRLLQRLTVAELFSLLNQFEKGSDAPIADLKNVLQQLKQENEDYEADCMRRDANLGSINCGDLPEADEPLTSVLLTGPTGFFGPFLLSSLLLQTPYTYYVLTRAADQASGMGRIRSSLRSARLWTPDLQVALEKRVHIVCGDIAQHNLGIRSEKWKSLTTRVQAIIHNAALVNYVLNYNALKPHNVDGTRELLRFSCTGTKKEFHFISSTIIFGWTSKGEPLESENNEDMLNLDFGYAQSKWVAEQLVFAAEKQGLNVKVYRPAFISASTNGIASKDDIVIRLLAFMINHGIAVNARNQISFLPADVTANNIAAIFKQRQTANQTLHVTVDDYYNLSDITRLITEEYGYPFVYYDIPTFVAEITRRCAKEDPLYPLLDFFNRSHPKITAMQHKRYGNDRYREARQLSGNSYSQPTLQQTVSYLMSYMLREGIIAGSPRTAGQ
ncbi:MAG: thioester reductase domain-containing protein [Deltaproteobacteria bacterium]|nr:MAG: thioester reductase domain-containing protein [Deltaproteobacteria bacterium]